MHRQDSILIPRQHSLTPYSARFHHELLRAPTSSFDANKDDKLETPMITSLIPVNCFPWSGFVTKSANIFSGTIYNVDLTLINIFFYEVKLYGNMPRPLATGKTAIDNQLDGAFVVLV